MLTLKMCDCIDARKSQITKKINRLSMILVLHVKVFNLNRKI